MPPRPNDNDRFCLTPLFLPVYCCAARPARQSTADTAQPGDAMKWLLLCSSALYLFGGHKRALFCAALATELAYLAVRGVALGRLPLIGPHDTLVFFSASVAVMAVPFCFASLPAGSRRF